MSHDVKDTTIARVALLPAALLTTVAGGLLLIATGISSARADHHGEMKDEAMAGKDIVTTAVEADGFNTLVEAVKAAGLVETLQGEGPFTVFAPTDEAFAALPEGTLDSLLADKAALTEVLTYHVVPGKVTAEQVVGMDSAETVQGQSIDITTEGDTVMVDGATVIQADIMASNGVIHVIDQVILPE